MRPVQPSGLPLRATLRFDICAAVGFAIPARLIARPQVEPLGGSSLPVLNGRAGRGRRGLRMRLAELLDVLRRE